MTRRVTIVHRAVAFTVGALSTAFLMWGSYMSIRDVHDHSGTMGAVVFGAFYALGYGAAVAVIGGGILLLFPRTRGYGHLLLWLGLGSGLVILALLQFGEALL